ncbi:MAG: hypothetical protein JWN30_983 [Bacilli bacterium]|nr:hypothetical protein [Bacilli bacterium]
MTTQTIPAPAWKVLEAYTKAMQQNMGNCVEAVYIYGSIALNAFVEHASDIDFITVVNRPLCHEDIALLAHIHHEIARSCPNPVMMGSYLQWIDLGKTQNQLNPYPYYYENEMHGAGHCDINPVTWWILKQSGLAVIGPDVKDLQLQVNLDVLLGYVHHNMNTYWAGWIERLETGKSQLINDLQITDADIDQRIEWTVLGMLRQYYTLKEKSIISKLGAGEYGLTELPEQWHPLIREAMHIRLRNPERYYESRQQRINDGIELLKWIRSHCNELVS